MLEVETPDRVTANYQTRDGQARDDANNATGYTSWLTIKNYFIAMDRCQFLDFDTISILLMSNVVF